MTSARFPIPAAALAIVLLAPSGEAQTERHAHDDAPRATADASRSGLPPLLDEAREVALATSAGPAHLAKDAALWALRRGGYARVREGRNGFTCLVERDHPASLAPVCYDEEGSRTIVPAVVELARLRETGLAYADAKARVDASIRAGTLAAPARVVMSYMLSKDQVLYTSPTGERVGAWRPHVMLFGTGLTNAAIGAAGPESEGPTVADEGNPMAYLVIAVPEWSDGTAAR